MFARDNCMNLYPSNTHPSIPAISLFIVIRGDWLWKAAIINDKNNSAAVNYG